MIISKIIEESSIDYPGKFGPVIFIFGCNFKCGFCHNPELVGFKDNENIKERSRKLINKLENIKGKINSGWYNGVTITGGEPCLNSDLGEFCEKLKNLGLSVKLDTNGSNPKLLKELIDKKLIDYVAIDIKANKENYNKFTGVSIDLGKIEESVKILSGSEIKFELRTTFAPVIDEKIRWLSEKEVEKMRDWIKNTIKKKCIWKVQTFVARDKGEILDNKYSIENLGEEFRETPKELLEKYRDILSLDFDVEIV